MSEYNKDFDVNDMCKRIHLTLEEQRIILEKTNESLKDPEPNPENFKDLSSSY